MNTLYKLVRHSNKYRHVYLHILKRNKSITGYEQADNAIRSVTGGKIYRWLDAYEDFTGLSEVRQAQETVTKAETNYRQVQEQRRSTQQQNTVVQTKIKTLALEIEKTNRGTDAYLDLVTKEHEIIKEEKVVLDRLMAIEEEEKNYFSLLSSALRESHEKERARAERTKYWGIIGSVIGALIGIFGTTINNHLRMKELRKIVSTSVAQNDLYREQAVELNDIVKGQFNTIFGFLTDIKTKIGLPIEQQQSSQTYMSTSAETVKLGDLREMMERQENVVKEEIGKVYEALELHPNTSINPSAERNAVYVGHEIETLIHDTEKSLEWKMKIQALGTVTLIYAGAAIIVPILFKCFSPGGGAL